MKFKKIISIILIMFIGLLIGCTDPDFEDTGIIFSVENYFFKLNDYKLDCNDGDCKIIIYAESKVPVINVEAKVNLYNSSNTIYTTMNLSLDEKIKANKEFKIKGDISHSYCNKFKKLQVEFEGESYVNPYEYLNVCTVTFVYNNGQDDKTIFLEKGSRLSQPSTPIKENYIFEGWYIDKQFSQKYDFNRSVNQNIYIFAKFSVDYDKVSEKINNSIINCSIHLQIQRYDDWWNPFGDMYQGSGVVFDYKDGYFYALTNRHNVEEGRYGVRVVIREEYGITAKAEVVSVSDSSDLAIIKFKKQYLSKIQVINLSKNDAKVGDDIITIGCPGGEINVISFGKIQGFVDNNVPGIISFSAKVYKHSAETYKGSSGSAILNMDFELVGLHYAGSENNNQDTGHFEFGLAMPVSIIYEYLNKCYY